jgi:FtsH-binding integral membrane protein
MSSVKKTLEEKKEVEEKTATTVRDEIMEDIGLQKYILKSLWYAGGMTTATLAISAYAPMLYHPLDISFGGLAVAFVSVIAFKNCKYEVLHTYINNEKRYYSKNSVPRLIAAGGVVVGMGACLSPIMQIQLESYPGLLTTALLTTTSVSAGVIALSMYKPSGSLVQFGGFLMGTLTGFVSLGVASILSHYIFPGNSFAMVWHRLDTYLGIPLFAGLLAFDIHMAVEQYKAKNPDHLGNSINLYLDFINLLVRIMSIQKKD